ncbi:hypothetical protein GFL15_24315 [Rhizobium leguminosarum bv. viciae]|nr:hypothetical protein [Rhizobium leguminosarum bv. viciae]
MTDDMKGELTKVEVTTNEKVDPEVDVSNTCTFYFRRIWSWKKSVFHLITSRLPAWRARGRTKP